MADHTEKTEQRVTVCQSGPKHSCGEEDVRRGRSKVSRKERRDGGQSTWDYDVTSQSYRTTWFTQKIERDPKDSHRFTHRFKFEWEEQQYHPYKTVTGSGKNEEIVSMVGSTEDGEWHPKGRDH
jgi:hypothetical protein